jgi:alcohol dehydrogenase class IV
LSIQFEFATATRILFGAGTLEEVAPIATEWGRTIFIVTGSSGERAELLLRQLGEKGLESTVFKVSGEPTIEVVLAGVERARDAKSNLVIGIGGGSVLDTGKAVAALLTNAGELTDYLEVIGKGQSLTKTPAPYIAIPTTAGTGTEVTRNSVIASPEHRVKVSLRSPLMLPRLALIDPLLTYSMPPAITASTGLDALTQLVEPFVSNGLQNRYGKHTRMVKMQKQEKTCHWQVFSVD